MCNDRYCVPILVPVLAQQQVPMIRKLQRTVEINHVRYIDDRIVDVPFLSTCVPVEAVDGKTSVNGASCVTRQRLSHHCENPRCRGSGSAEAATEWQLRLTASLCR